MAKRKLNRQQRSRIDAKQASKLSKQGNEALSGASDAGDDANFGPELNGTVTSHYRAAADVEPEGETSIVRCHLRANLPALVTGDRVTWRQGQGELAGVGIIEAVHPRTSELCRPDSYGKMKLVAANITRAVIVIAPEPEPFTNLIDRYLVAAEHLGLDVTLVLNKAELGNESTDTLLTNYQALGYSAFKVSSHQGTGMDTLTEHLATGCSIFVGQSGVGKSSIIQALLPDEAIKVGELSHAAKKGRHTTTHAKLYHFPTGGDCIDSPGIREFGLWHLDADDILNGFAEIRPFIGSCKFRNCNHISDKGCAIVQAAEAGDIRTERYQSYCNIVQSLDAVTMQTDKSLKS